MKFRKMLKKFFAVMAITSLVLTNTCMNNCSVKGIKLDTNALSNYSEGTYWSDWQMKGMGLDLFQDAFKDKADLPQIVVAVLDTGCNYNDTGFAGRILVDRSICVTDADTVLENSGHGTNTTRGVIDASPSNVKVLPVRVTDSSGAMYSSYLIKGINAAVNANVDVIQICAGSYMGTNGTLESDLVSALKAADNKGIIVCASAGNDSVDTKYQNPASSPNCISVAAADNGMTITYRSNYNAVITSYSHNDGTSYATPNVSAVAAMLKTIDRSVNRQKMVQILSTMAIDVGEKGKDSVYGNGFMYMGDFIQNNDIHCLHNYNRQEISNATCSSSGQIRFSCSKCGTSFTRSEAPRHQYLVTYTTADCTHDGTFLIKCDICGDVKTDKVIKKALGHYWMKARNMTICLRCNTIQCSTHTYSKMIISEGDCVHDGTAKYTCKDCGDNYTETIPATGTHSYSEEVIQPATCTADGTAKFTCSVCGDNYTEIIPASGHAFAEKAARSATCNSDGVTTYTCSNCGYFYTDTIQHTNVHTYAKEVVQAATCTSDGIIKYTCAGCGECYTETTPASGAHSYTAKVTKSATCKADGVKTYTCSECGDTYTEAIPSTDAHTYKTSTTKKATCSKAGTKKYTCSKCGYSYTESIPATGAHSYTSTVTKKATCTTPGVRKYTCKTCKHSYEEEMAATGHKVGKNNTCTVCKKKVTTSGKKC